MDELMKLFANKSAPIDPNDMPLCTLIENNNKSMDVNFVGRNNFGKMLIEETLILGLSLVIPLIIMVILIICPLILRIV